MRKQVERGINNLHDINCGFLQTREKKSLKLLVATTLNNSMSLEGLATKGT
jgi:hypothetical protein